jgi:serine/threonine-protein kinase
LKAGKAVDLIGATGAPAYYRWVTPESSEQRTALKKDDGTFAVTAHDQALLELVPNPMSDQYRLQVEIKHDSSEGLHGQVGIYFAHTRFQPKKDRGHAFCGLYYNDLGDEVAQRPDGRAPGNALRLYRSALLESVMTGPNRMMTPHWHFAPVGPRGNFRWRKLRLELTGEALTIFWEGQQVLHLSRDQVLGCKVFPDPRFDAESLQCEPRGGLGLYLYRSTASFRNVRLEPILSR